MSEIYRTISDFSLPRDSRWYAGRAIPTSIYLKEQMIPPLQRAIRHAVNGETEYLGTNAAYKLVNGFNAMAFGKENCPFGIEIDMNQNVLLVDNPERLVSLDLHSKMQPKVVKKDIMVVESFSLYGFDEPKNMEGFITFILKHQKNKGNSVILYGALDCPIIVLAKEVDMREKLTFANDLYKYKFYMSYYLSKVVHGLIQST